MPIDLGGVLRATFQGILDHIVENGLYAGNSNHRLTTDGDSFYFNELERMELTSQELDGIDSTLLGFGRFLFACFYHKIAWNCKIPFFLLYCRGMYFDRGTDVELVRQMITRVPIKTINSWLWSRIELFMEPETAENSYMAKRRGAEGLDDMIEATEDQVWFILDLSIIINDSHSYRFWQSLGMNTSWISFISHYFGVENSPSRHFMMVSMG
jgi:hypothetical protein